MTPPIDPETLAKLRAHIAAAALATVASGAIACKKEQPTSAPNNPMPHTVNEPAQPTPNTPAIPQPTAQELANLPQGRTTPTQDPNEPANLPEGGAAAAASGDASAAPQVPNDTPHTQSVNQPTPNLPAPPPPGRRTPPGNG
jgi:hypothetical protein